MEKGYLAREELQALLDVLKDSGYQTMGPQIRNAAIVYEPLNYVSQLPAGYEDEQSPGSYRLYKKTHNRNFAWANTAASLKVHTFAPVEPLWKSIKDGHGQLQFTEIKPATIPTAILGVRACDLAGLQLQDAHFLNQEYPDPYYAARRESLFLIAVNCSQPAASCFCHATGDGPFAKTGYDLVLTELEDGFIVEAGSLGGKTICEELPLAEISDTFEQQKDDQLQQSIARQTRKLPTQDLRLLLANRQDNDKWEQIAQSCLACGNCTSVCPSCFCHREEDQQSINGDSEHQRLWDSCFSSEHSYIHGIVIRNETRFRYRQWLTHKFSSWVEQYGRIGCSGCGRCITWCPVGIDVTEALNNFSEDACV